MAYKVYLPISWISISSTGRWLTRYTYHSLGFLSDPMADGLQGILTNQLDLYLIHWPMAYKVHLPFTWISISSTGRWLTRYLPLSWISISSTGRWLTRYTYQSVGSLPHTLADGLQGTLTNQLDFYLIHWPVAYKVHLPISWISI